MSDFRKPFDWGEKLQDTLIWTAFVYWAVASFGDLVNDSAWEASRWKRALAPLIYFAMISVIDLAIRGLRRWRAAKQDSP